MQKLARRVFLTGLVAAPVVMAYDKLMPVKVLDWRLVRVDYTRDYSGYLEAIGLDPRTEIQTQLERMLGHRGLFHKWALARLKFEMKDGLSDTHELCLRQHVLGIDESANAVWQARFFS